LKMDGMEVHRVSPYPFITLGFLILLFYVNIFWLFKRMLKYKHVAARLVVTAAWFSFIFVANYFVVKLLLQRPTPAKPPAISWSTASRDTSANPNATQGIPRFLEPSSRDADRQMPPALPQFSTDLAAWPNSQFTMLLISLAVLGTSIAYFFLKQWGRTELMRSQLAAQQLDTEIKFLKSQVNPHFLFNTLNNLFSMAQARGNDELADGISTLSGMMRYMIYESNEGSVPLQKEIEYLQHFIVLNKLRYADGEATVVFNYPANTDGCFVAPMLFIPFVENAFKHGVRIGQPSEIDIAISLHEKQLHFTCSNASYGFIKKMDDEKSGIGLENIRRRLALLYPGKHTLVIDDSNGHFNVNLEIDLG
jgi:two-component system LytT family sensor kinase